MAISKYLKRLENLKGKEIIVTGGTSGIGLNIVDHLLYKEADVIVLARNVDKAKEVKTKFENKYPNCHLDFIFYNQNDLASIDNAINQIIEHHSSFYAMIFNAGVLCSKKCYEGLSVTMKTNFIGTAYFIKNLLPHLKGEHRIIMQGSLVAGFKDININSLEDKTSPLRQYTISKCGVEALYYHYSNIYKGDITFYLVEPGLTSSDIIRHFSAPIRMMGKAFLKIFAQSTKKAALPAIYALQSNVKPSFIVPRSPLASRGYPKIKEFPKNRQREHLLSLVNPYIEKEAVIN